MNSEQAIKKYVPMTDSMFHILLVLNEEMHGYAIEKYDSSGVGTVFATQMDGYGFAFQPGPMSCIRLSC